MAKIVNALLQRSGLFSLYNVNASVKINVPAVYSIRHLYAQTTLGVNGYVESRERVKSQFINMSEKFRTKMSEYVIDSSKKNIIFTEDLKNMIHLAEDDTNDITLVINMMKKFNQQNKELRFGSFVFGPVVMRMFYFLNKPNEALECFTCKELEGFFDQLITYQLLLDLLFENARYDDMINAFEIIKAKQIQGTKYPKNIIVLVMAACYKKNSVESLEYALKLWKELNEVGHQPMRRAATFCAGLAVNQGKYEATLELISNVKNQNYMTVRNIKALALVEFGRLDDVLVILRSVLDIDDPGNKKHTFTKDVLERIHVAIEKQDNPVVKNEFQRIEKLLKESGHVSDTVLDSVLCSEIESPPFIRANQRNQMYQTNVSRNRYQGHRTNNFRVYSQRPGLSDLN